MADLRFASVPGKISTGTAVKTLIQLLAPTNQRVKVDEISVSFDGTSNTATPIYCELVRQTSAGTFTNTTTLRVEDGDLTETIQTVGKDTATAEPTDGAAVLVAELVHPQTGWLWQAPFGKSVVIGTAGRLGFRVTAAASVNAAPRLVAEE